MKVIGFFLLLVIWAVAVPEFSSDETKAERLHNGMNGAEFRKLAASEEEIDFGKIDYDLLAAVVFHETNFRRLENDLSALKYDPKVRKAARIQAEGILRVGKISHLHPDENKKTLEDRLKIVGLTGRFWAENVAMIFAIKYEAGTPYFPRMRDGEEIYSVKANGPPIPPHTYQSFAVSLLDSWMDSPGHRKNILSEDPTELGCECLPAPAGGGPRRMFGVQVFFKPW